VEDNIINQKVAKAMFSKFDCDVILAENGKIALELAGTSEFDIIFMDMQMPVMGGLEASEKIKILGNHNSKIPIVAMTANARKEDREKCDAVGMVDFISKPIDPSDLRLKYEKWCW
jgi:CheY-like chemotaxis protein